MKECAHVSRPSEFSVLDYERLKWISNKDNVVKLKAQNLNGKGDGWQVLTLNVEEKLKPVVEYFRSIGLNKERDIEMLLVRNAQILCCSIDKNLRPKFAFFKGLGLNESAIANMIVLFPSMLGQSIEGSLGPKYEFLVNEMHRSIDEVVDFPQVGFYVYLPCGRHVL